MVYKECLVEDAVRDKELIEKELKELKKKVEDLKKSNEILLMIEENEKECDRKMSEASTIKDRSMTRVAKSAQWARNMQTKTY